MKWIIPSGEVAMHHRRKVGGKAFALSRLLKDGTMVPDAVFITHEAYLAYLTRTGLRERISLELHRKAFSQMRWEEIWDCATRIRNMFVRTPMPDDVESALRTAIAPRFGDVAVSVRSSALDEDESAASFAGLHESFVNLRGLEAILKHIRLVWASLWSDAALLYRQEIGLNVTTSAMAVIVQKMVAGDRSGVAFTRNPTAPSQGVVESVYGLNQGLVDGSITPDRWILDRRSGDIISHAPAQRRFWMVAGDDGLCKEPLPQALVHTPPLTVEEVKAVFEMALRAEAVFDSPQDVEWTVKDRRVYLLQSRPVTTLSAGDDRDKRSWYLSLHRSFDNLKALRRRIEDEFIPAMTREAERLVAVNLDDLSEPDLAAEIRRRWEINHKWVGVYWEQFIPFAHGMRLFGQFYNDVLQPDDPYEFIDLLSDTQMVSVERNRMLAKLAEIVRRDARLSQRLRTGAAIDPTAEFGRELDRFVREFGDLSCSVTGGTQCHQEKETLVSLLLEMASHPPSSAARPKTQRTAELTAAFFDRVGAAQRAKATEMLDLARASYQLRDDDNIYLGRIESQLLAAIQAGRRRLSDPRRVSAPESDGALSEILADLDHRTTPKTPPAAGDGQGPTLMTRQLVGQPAGPGIARGVARVIRQHADLADFRKGDVMVCDAVDPNMTFVVPLAAAVVERRGGMLIHGAIIAREYGLPAVTGVTDVTTLVQTGELVTVDGFLGIVTVGSGDL
jgi:pyruvate,water dikinase